MFCNFESTKTVISELPIITVLPRKRKRASQRNVPESVWEQVVQELRKDFLVVIAGTPNGSALRWMSGRNIVNLIDSENRTDEVIRYLCQSVLAVSSQGGGTHIALFAGDVPVYIIGHEKERHCNFYNRMGKATSFRYVTDYRCISSDIILDDIRSFLGELEKANYVTSGPTFEYVLQKDIRSMTSLMVK